MVQLVGGIAAPVYADNPNKCPTAMSQLDCDALYGGWTSWDTTQACASGATGGSGTGPTIVVDPGHSGKNIVSFDSSNGLEDHDYPSGPDNLPDYENQEVFYAALLVKQKLVSDGYKVILTKGNDITTNVSGVKDPNVQNGAERSLGHRARADVANNANAALALSIHDDHSQTWDSFAAVYTQKIGLWRQSTKTKQITHYTDHTINGKSVADLSQQYGHDFVTARKAAEKHNVQFTDVNFKGRQSSDPNRNVDDGTITLVQLYSKVPWVYNEVGAPLHGRLPDPQIREYADGLVKGVEAAVPVTAGSGGNGSGNGVSFDDSQSAETNKQTTIDDDGIDPPPGNGSTHKGSTSYANGKLGALHTNYIALNAGWAQAHGIVLGDVAQLTYKGKTAYAVYGDNHTSSTAVHAEISVAAAAALAGPSELQTENNLSGVHTTVYPNTSKLLNGSVDQTKIDQVGAQASGGGSGSSTPASCCNDTSSSSPTGNQGSGGSSLDQVKAFAAEPITSTWNISNSTAEQWFLKQAGAHATIAKYGLTSGNIGKITAAVEAEKVSPVFFYLYTVNEGGGAGGFINHYGSDVAGGGVANATRDAKYLVTQAQDKSAGPAIGGGEPAGMPTAEAKQILQALPLGSIGVVYIQATSAVTAELEALSGKGPVSKQYGKPLSDTMKNIKSMNGDPMQGGASAGSCTSGGVTGVGLQKAISWAEMIAKNNGYGYDQPGRESGWAKWQSDPSCTNACGSFDCSSFVSAALTVAGYFKTNPEFATGSEAPDLIRAGFTKVASSAHTSAGLHPGDVLLANGHTALYIGNDTIVDARINENGGIAGGKVGDQTGGEIEIHKFNDHPWIGVYRTSK